MKYPGHIMVLCVVVITISGFCFSFSYPSIKLQPGHYYHMLSMGQHAAIQDLTLKSDFTFSYDVKVTSLSHHLYKGKWHIKNDTLCLEPSKGKINLNRNSGKLKCPCADEKKSVHCRTKFLFIRNDTLYAYKYDGGKCGGLFSRKN